MDKELAVRLLTNIVAVEDACTTMWKQFGIDIGVLDTADTMVDALLYVLTSGNRLPEGITEQVGHELGEWLYDKGASPVYDFDGKHDVSTPSLFIGYLEKRYTL
jgi:hypothetical protein